MEGTDSSRRSIALFEADQPGDYTISFVGTQAPAVILVTKDHSVIPLLTLVFGSCAINMLAIAGIALGTVKALLAAIYNRRIESA